MDIDATKTAATQLLDDYYQIHTSDLPTQRTKSQWQAENKRGLFLGIIQEGEDSHIIQLYHLLATNQFTQQQEFSTTSQLADPQHRRTFIDDMFAHYILPFHKDYCDTSTCHTPLSSNPPSRSNSAEDLDYVPEERELTHKDLKKAVEKRDSVCLFCWGRLSLEGAHIIAQKNISMVYDEPSLLLRAGLTQKHQVQNGVLLCKVCHDQFDQMLEIYEQCAILTKKTGPTLTTEKQLNPTVKWPCISSSTTQPNYQIDRPWNSTKQRALFGAWQAVLNRRMSIALMMMTTFLLTTEARVLRNG